MNKRHYEHTLPNIRGSLSNTYYAMLFAALVYSCGRDGERGSGAVTACSSAPSVGALNVNLLNNQTIWE